MVLMRSTCDDLSLSFVCTGYAVGMVLAIILFFVVGVSTYFLIHGSAENFCVAGRSLPLFVVAMTLGGQSIDSNALLGNHDNSYSF